MNTPIEESNLAHIGSEEDHAAKKAAAETEAQWEGAGQAEGVEVWRVENVRDESGNPHFGINRWPRKEYGNFHTGDSYIVLQTIENEDDPGAFNYDLFFWIGSESSQDEFGVAAYKAVELDDLLGDAPVQHREVQYHESAKFLKCFQGSIKYLAGGISSGFRVIDKEDIENAASLGTRLYHIRRSKGRVIRSLEVPLKCSSMNQGDAFVLETPSVVYTWFGDICSPFERNKAAEVAHNIVSYKNGKASLKQGVEDEDEEFWSLLEGKIEDIKPAEAVQDSDVFEQDCKRMCIVKEENSVLSVEECAVDRSNLVSGDVCMIDTGTQVFAWIGKGSSRREQVQALLMAQKYVSRNSNGKQDIPIVRVLEGQESRIDGFNDIF